MSAAIESTAPSFSVIIDSYNYRDYICTAVDSVLNQTLPPRQIVIVDDGSSDGTVDLLRDKYSQNQQITLLLKANGGQFSALAAGAAAVSDGDVVCFLDSDDWWEPDYLSRLAAVYARDRSVDFVFCNLRLCGDQAGLRFADTADRDLGISVLRTYFKADWIGAPTSALSMKRALLAQLIDLPAALHDDWRLCADDVLIYGASVLGAHKFYSGAALVHYRRHVQNGSLRLDRNENNGVVLHFMKVRRLLAHFGRRQSMGLEHLQMAKHEFKTLQRPTWAETRLYMGLAWRAPLSWSKRLENVFAIFRHFRRNRRGGTNTVSL